MCFNNPSILITREIDEALLNKLISKGFEVDIIPFIHTEIIRIKQVQLQIEAVLKLNTAVVFTSKNAVRAVSEYFQNKKPNWKIYCIGNTTRQLIENFLEPGSIIATADNATVLAERIIANKQINEVYFFCGDKKRNELPGLLRENNTIVHEIEVYKTSILQHKIQKKYDSVLFFSPSAVNGFFDNNVLSDKTILFAIGNTTAEEIRKFSKNKIVICETPSKKHVIENVIIYFES